MNSKTMINKKKTKKTGRNFVLAIFEVLFVLLIAGAVYFGYMKFFASADSKVTEVVETNNTQSDVSANEVSDVQSNEITVVTTQALAPEVSADTTTESEHENEEIPQIYEGEFELPLQGATVYAMVDTELSDRSGAEVKTTVEAGEGLQILGEEGCWLIVKTANGEVGYLYSYECMINLCDIIPSIVYTNTNSTESIYRSSGYDLPGVTGTQLYNVEQYNERLGRTEFNMPICYETAKKVMAAQKAAMAEGYSLRIYETYRPLATQKAVSESLSNLATSNSTVRNGINGGGWSESWFIAQNVSNHQRGYAMDVSLVKVNSTEICTSGNYAYVNVADWDEIRMPSEMHELSNASIALERGVTSSSATEWKNVPLASSMNDEAIRLQSYCTNAGFTPLASEWWHFNDLDAKNDVAGSLSDGTYVLQANLSVIPE